VAEYYDRQAKLAANLLQETDARSPAEERQLPVIDAWAKACIEAGPDEETGDVSELPFEPEHSAWARFSVGSETCRKNKCRYKDECFPNAANKRARAANIVVTNYHMLCAHLQVRAATGFDIVLPPFDILIGDEYHAFGDIVSDSFGFSVTSESLKRLGKKMRDLGNPLGIQALEGATRAFFGAMIGLKRDPDRYKARIRANLRPHETKAWEHLKGTLEETKAFYQQQTAHHMKEEDTLANLVERCDKALANLSSAMEDPDGTKDPNAPGRRVHFLEEEERCGLVLASKLIHPGDILSGALYGHHSRERVVKRSCELCGAMHSPNVDCDTQDAPEAIEGEQTSVIGMSATLCTEGGNFKYVAEKMGTPADRDELVAESPFDWPKQCLFIVPETMPEPRGGMEHGAEYRNAVAQHLERIVALAGGRTLGLFTSRKSLEHTYDTISPYCARHRITLLKQGAKSKTRLVEDFKNDITSVLLGTKSFWAGVDIPGEALSVVVIDRIPFPTPDDPILDCIAEQEGSGSFFRYNVPEAIVEFRQAFGRLIRSMECKGVVVCLDRRIITKAYGRSFLRALPPVPKSTKLEHIPDWLHPPPPVPEPAWDEL
jgi:ATP-dependent DNA helicase DinG